MSWGTKEKTNDEPDKKFIKRQEEVFGKDVIRKWLYSRGYSQYKTCCLVYGLDGTGKTGIVLDYLTEQEKKDGHKIVVLDLDGGAIPLLKYHDEKNIIIKNPMEINKIEGQTNIDYNMTMERIRATIDVVHDDIEKEKIKAVVLDGVSTLLKHAEYQMRIDKNITADGGVQLRYWVQRNKLFIEILEQIKALPCDKFFVSHEDFILDDKENPSAVKSKTNQMMFQKIRCERVVGKDKVVYSATIDKSKYNVNSEGQKFEFLTVEKEKKEFKWEAQKVFELL